MIAILQGRLGSSRLPAKGFLTFFDKVIWERVFLIVKNIPEVDSVIFVTGNNKENLVVKKFVERFNIKFYVGDEHNVLSRFQDVAKTIKSDYFLRLTCDNYLIQPEVIENLFKLMKSESSDYANVEPLSHFSGEIVKTSFFNNYYKDSLPSEYAIEHVTWDIRNDLSVKKTIANSDFLGINHNEGITLDTLDDFVMMKKLENKFPKLKQLRCLEEIKRIQKLGPE